MRDRLRYADPPYLKEASDSILNAESKPHAEAAHSATWGKGNGHASLVGLQGGTVTLEGSSADSYTTKQALTSRSSSHAPWHLPEGPADLRAHRYLHTDVHGSFIHHRPNLEATERPAVGGGWPRAPHNATLSALQRREPSGRDEAWPGLVK